MMLVGGLAIIGVSIIKIMLCLRLYNEVEKHSMMRVVGVMGILTSICLIVATIVLYVVKI